MREKSGENRGGRRLLRAANWTVRIVGGAVFLVLAWYAMRYTQYIQPGGREIPVNVRDSMTNNLLAAALAVVLMVCLVMAERRISAKAQRRIVHAALALAMVWIGVAGLWWIQAVERVPEGDQAFVYGGASYFLNGDYSFLDKYSYCGMFPYQLGLIALMELLFLVVGPFNYFAFQVLCAMLSVGIVFLGYRLLRHVTERMSAALLYCLLTMGCLPLIFYTSWVYGDIPSIFFALLAADLLLAYDKKGKWGYLAGIVASMTMVMLFRKNSLILLIALALTGGVYAVWKRDRKIVVAILLSALVPYLAYQGIYKMYEVRSGYEHCEGIPALGWVSMGMQEMNGIYGWYYDYYKPIYYENEGDRKLCSQIYQQDIRDRLKVFRENPSYTVTFYREKVLSQWNEPLYQSLYFNNLYVEDRYRPDPSSFVSKISNEYFPRILWLCDRLQFMIYLGMACYFLFAVKRDGNLLQHLLAVTMIGGFLFSILWEAKARYIFPYYITMFPCAVIGYEQLLRFAVGAIRRIAGGRSGESEEEAGKAA